MDHNLVRGDDEALGKNGPQPSQRMILGYMDEDEPQPCQSGMVGYLGAAGRHIGDQTAAFSISNRQVNTSSAAAYCQHPSG